MWQNGLIHWIDSFNPTFLVRCRVYLSSKYNLDDKMLVWHMICLYTCHYNSLLFLMIECESLAKHVLAKLVIVSGHLIVGTQIRLCDFLFRDKISTFK